MMCLYSTSSSYCISYTETLYIIIFLTVAITSRYRSDFVCSLLLRQTDNADVHVRNNITMFMNTHRRARSTSHTQLSCFGSFGSIRIAIYHCMYWFTQRFLLLYFPLLSSLNGETFIVTFLKHCSKM